VKKTLVVLGLLFLPFFASAAGMVASGWGEAGVDGTYSQVGDVNGFPAWLQGGFYLCHYDVDHTWKITDDSSCDSGAGTTYYYTDDAVATPDLVSNWIANSGANPTGTITAESSPTTFNGAAVGTIARDGVLDMGIAFLSILGVILGIFVALLVWGFGIHKVKETVYHDGYTEWNADGIHVRSWRGGKHSNWIKAIDD